MRSTGAFPLGESRVNQAEPELVTIPAPNWTYRLKTYKQCTLLLVIMPSTPNAHRTICSALDVLGSKLVPLNYYCISPGVF